MAIVSSDIKIKYSVKTGSAGNSTAGTASGSLGKYISTSEITSASASNVFDTITGDENAASDVEYRCVFVHNSHATLTWQSPVVWLTDPAGGATSAISIDTTAASAIGSSSAQAKEVADESTAPATQTFTSPSTKGTGLALGDLPPGQCRAVWWRRTAANTAAVDNEQTTLSVEGDTAA